MMKSEKVNTVTVEQMDFCKAVTNSQREAS